jgi:enoyl-CoA hydratase
MSASLVVDGPIARLTLERPDVLNALDRPVAAALEGALDDLGRAPGVSVVIVSGRGRAFCAGNDIAEMPRLAPEEAVAVSRRWQAIVDGFAALPQ